MNISNKDREILRELAKKQLEYAKSPEMDALKKEWLLHNTFRGQRPMIQVELDSFADDLIPQILRCETEDARKIERKFYYNFMNHESFGDDAIVPDFYPVRAIARMKLLDLDAKVENHESSIGYHFIPVINDLGEDFKKFGKTTYSCDKEATQKDIDDLNEIFGDILPAQLNGNCLSAVPTQNVVRYMGMENMMFAMYDYPELFKELMQRIVDSYIGLYAYMEENGLILPTTDMQWLNQGSWCFTDELPETKNINFGAQDVWGFLDSQETVGISADMFEEFIFPYYKQIADCFGLLSYGCCEPVAPLWERCISKFENLRKVSISAWCNEEIMGEYLRGQKVIYHRKPNANYLGVGTVLDEEEIRNSINKTLAAARGCKVEISQRDVYDVNKNPDKVRKYVEIIRQCCIENYKG